jgi:hypothetical protein
VTDYTVRNWPANYAGRGRPFDFGLYAISWPSTRFLFDRAEQQGISYRNYGEAYTGTLSLADADRRPSDTAELERRLAHSDLGSLSGGCYVSVLIVGGLDFLSGRYQDVFDSTPPAGANPSAESRLECFKRQFQEQLVANAVPAFNYLVLPNDHTAATLAGARTPRAMVADNDYALGELVDLISHSAIWKSSAILVVEDDAQSGADHVDAHRIPALVISPYTRAGAVVHDRFDQLSFIRTLELILGMRPLTMFDANATPLDSVLTPTAGNAAPYDAIRPKANLLERNTARSAAAIQSATLRFDAPDEIPEHVLDGILWKSVHGAHSTPPPPGPNAPGGGE